MAQRPTTSDSLSPVARRSPTDTACSRTGVRLPAPLPAVAGKTRSPCTDTVLPILRFQQPAVLRVFSRIVRRQQRLKVAVPLPHKVKSTFLHPAVKVLLRNRIGIAKDRILGLQDLYRRVFHRNSRPA